MQAGRCYRDSIKDEKRQNCNIKKYITGQENGIWNQDEN
jgi:hypothetical protein